MSNLHKPHHILRALLLITKDLPEQFERKRIWGPRSIMAWLMLLTFPDRKTSYRISLTLFKGFVQQPFGWIKMPSLGSVTRARAKMTPSECRLVLRNVVDLCEKTVGKVEHRYGTRRFIAFDGTRIITPRSHDTVVKLHRFKGPNGVRTHYPQGLLVTAVDVFRRIPLDWIFVGKGIGERTAMNSLLDTITLREGDVAIIDRGLPSRKLFGLLLERKVDIVARMTTSTATGWKEVSEFMATKKKSGTIDIQVGESGAMRKVQVRIVERDRQRGRPRKMTKKEPMVILTTLTEEEGFTRDEIIKIYGARWGIETLFKELKSFMSIEPMHSENVAGCEQEICASLIWMALGTLIQAEAESTLLNGRRVVRADCLRAASIILVDLLEGRSITDRWENHLEGLRKYAASLY